MVMRTKYWVECVESAAEEAGVILTQEQLKTMATVVEGGVDTYGMSFYAPSSNDLFQSTEDKYKQKIKELEQELEKYKNNAESAIKDALNIYSSDNVRIAIMGQLGVL
jgi:aspartate aminotransferase-like enzyme